MKRVLLSAVVFSGVILLAGCGEDLVFPLPAYVNAQQFEEVKMLCAKNDGLVFVQYLVKIRGGLSVPKIVYCKDGAQFSVSEDIQGKK